MKSTQIWNTIESNAFKLFCREIYKEAEKRGEKLEQAGMKKLFRNGEFVSFKTSRIVSKGVVPHYYNIHIKKADSKFGFIIRREYKEDGKAVENPPFYKILSEHCLLTLMNEGEK